MKLTRTENKVYKSLKNGAILVTDNTVKGATICENGNEYEISGRVFWSLVRKEVIRQQNKPPFEYVLNVNL